MNRQQAGFAHVAVLAIILFAAIAGAGVVIAGRANKSTSNNNEVTEQNSTLAEALPSDILSVDAIKTLAAQDSPDASLASVEIEQEAGVYLYKVQLANGTVLYFNAQTGAKVTHTSSDDDSDEQETETLPTGFTPTISYDRARQIAQEQKPGSSIKKIELETEENVVVYSVRFSDEARIDVNATTGAIVRTKPGKTSSPTPSSSASPSTKPTETPKAEDSHDENEQEDSNEESDGNSGRDDNR